MRYQTVTTSTALKIFTMTKLEISFGICYSKVPNVYDHLCVIYEDCYNAWI
jgi:hypothetical protein